MMSVTAGLALVEIKDRLSEMGYRFQSRTHSARLEEPHLSKDAYPDKWSWLAPGGSVWQRPRDPFLASCVRDATLHALKEVV